ncbi:fungal-specific transcription factor domain-containing protein [Lipomyces oligophaga]|uniref:fungal-specific transcription factor domain-containing protein n=1 Tax=Lipomyces oligophaga TaxID=45792 RepID=UPI0034CEBD6B
MSSSFHAATPTNGYADSSNVKLENSTPASRNSTSANIQSTDDQPSNQRKRRRSRKGLEKVFECEIDSCGKRFTRSEHLARHQLNHAPKEIFNCSWPGCSKSFVREDLKLRHLDRHRRRNEYAAAAAAAASAEEHHSISRTYGSPLPPPPTPMPILPIIDSSDRHQNPYVGTPGLPPQPHVPMPPHHHHPQQQSQSANVMSPIGVSASNSRPSSNIGASPLGVSPRSARSGGTGNIPAAGVSSNTTDLINWLFSDGMLSNARDLFLPSNFYSAFESPMDLPTMLTPPSPPPARSMSETKRLDILGLIPSLESEPDMELDSLHRFIALYWDRFHFQYPILHRPSFEADSTPGPLLWSMIMMGAHYGGSQELAIKIADNLRWVIFGSPGFHPPAKIWIIQSLLILEVYEKALSTRKLHERAHIHHATTLQLIRRGSTLIGSSHSAATSTPSGHSSMAHVDSSSEIWKRWIEAEMAKRAGFMAFILDVTHSALFAHSLVLSTHEIRLSLPCDESVWDSVPGDRTHAVRMPTMPFLKALKKLLNQQSVDTGRFGSVVLLCGLMSLSYQMEQLDLQISSLGWGAFRETWRTTLAPAMDFWKADYDRRYPADSGDNVGDGSAGNGGTMGSSRQLQRLVGPLWHMAHISMRVSIYDLQIFCGVHKVVGRPTRQQDFIAAKRRMMDWAISERAPAAVLHSARCLYEAMMVGDLLTTNAWYGYEGLAFVHQANILAHAAMVVWSYGYCLEGPESTILGDRDREAAAAAAAVAGLAARELIVSEEEEMRIPSMENGQAFLERVCQAGSPRELGSMKSMNRTVSLIRMVISTLRLSKCQLAVESCGVLSCCVQRSLGRIEQNVRGGRKYADE